MKKHCAILIIGLFLFIPLHASADSIGTGTIEVSWSSPIYGGYYLDYDGTVIDSTASGIEDGFYEYMFCVSPDHANEDEGVVFYSIDSSLAGIIGAGNYLKISQAAWIADNWNFYTDDAMVAQVAIWDVTGVKDLITISEYATAAQILIDAAITDYSTDTWALAIAGSYAGGGYQDFQDYLVPMSPVPEPATMLLLGSGLIGIAGFTRKKFGKK